MRLILNMKELRVLDTIRALATSAGPWLDRRWAVAAPACGLVAVAILFQWDLIPLVPQNKNGLTVQWWRIGTAAGLPTISLLVWFLTTQLYLRSGQGAKIGLAYDGATVDLSDWRRTKQILKDLFADGRVRKRVCLRFVPLRATQVKAVGQTYMKRYGFTILLVVGSTAPKPGSPQGSALSITISTKRQAAPYLKASLQNALAISVARARGSSPTLQDYQSIQAETLRDLLLLCVATHHFVNENLEDASTLLRVVDASLQEQFKPGEPPRFNIREFDVQCCLRRLHFPISQIPEISTLEERIAFAERAMCYFAEFAGVYIALSRAKFLLGNVQGAVELTNLIKQEISRLKETGVPISKGALLNVHLNSGFLSFVDTRWQNAHDSYMAMLAMEECASLNWVDLVEFIDYVGSLERFDGIPFLQVLYRTAAHQSVPAVLKDEAESWLKEGELTW
jgi:hypothetical protein